MREPPRPLRRFAGLFESIDWLVAAVLWLIDEALNLQHGQEQLTQMTDDLSSAVDRTEASTTAALAGIGRELQQVRDALAELAKIPNTDAIAARLNANADRIEAATAALSGDDPMEPTP
jgi:hypothetical protein